MGLSWRILKPFLGARIVKTGVAVFLTLLLVQVVEPGYAAFAAVAAILAIQPSVTRARELLLEQLLANLVGGSVAAILGLWLGPSPTAMAIGVVLVLGILHRLAMNEAASLAVVVVIFVMDRPHQDFLLYTGARMLAVGAGMLIGSLVNRYVRPPRFLARLKEELTAVGADVDTFISHLLQSLTAPEHFGKEQIKGEAKAIRRRLETVQSLLELSREDPGVRHSILVLEKIAASGFVFVERITDVHKLVLKSGGIERGPFHAAVVKVLEALQAYRQEAMAAALAGRHSDPVRTKAYQAALADLDGLSRQLIDEPSTRPTGLLLYGLAMYIGHMGARLEQLAALLKPTGEGASA